MSLENVKEYFSKHNLEDRILEMDEPTATVEDAARVHKVVPGQIGKTLSFKVEDEPVLIVVAGDRKIDNKKYKEFFGKKAKMLSLDEAQEYTGHPVGGICPFGLKRPIKTYLDVSLKEYKEILPAAGSRNSAVKLGIQELEVHSGSIGWIDVCKKSLIH